MPQWNVIRLEMARTPEFPEGSASRAYMLRVPLDLRGLIDDAALARRPAMATVRRFWPNEPDQSGYLVRQGNGWAFSSEPGDEDDENFFHLDSHPLRLGECVMLTERNGQRLPFKVVSSQADGLDLT